MGILSTQNQFARRATIVVALSAGLGVAAVAWAGTRPDDYLLHVRGIPLPHPYPWKGVLQWAVVALIEATAFVAVLRSFKNQAAACLVCSVVAACAALSIALVAMHQPAYFIAHLWWLVANLVVFLAVAIKVHVAGHRRRVA